MSANDTAYRTADLAVLEAFNAWVKTRMDIFDKRVALSEAVGRDIYVSGHGHGSRISGFERFDSDEDGDLVHHDGCLIVSTKRGQHNGLVVPNLKRKAGKAFAEELRTYSMPGLDLPGLPGMHVYGTQHGLVMGYPLAFAWDDVVFAMWGCDDAPMGEQWETIPLSTYYLALEQYRAAHPEEPTDDE